MRVLCAQHKSPAKYEYAVLKWDGPDRLFYNMPDHFELVHLEKKGIKIPGDAQNEEWCLAYGANQLSHEGWEPIWIREDFCCGERSEVN